jgi:aryl carrier-like protein
VVSVQASEANEESVDGVDEEDEAGVDEIRLMEMQKRLRRAHGA